MIFIYFFFFEKIIIPHKKICENIRSQYKSFHVVTPRPDQYLRKAVGVENEDLSLGISGQRMLVQRQLISPEKSRLVLMLLRAV